MVVALAVVALGLAALCVVSSAAKNLTVPAIVAGIVLFAYFMQGALDGVTFQVGSKNATMGFSVDAAEFARMKATVEELSQNLFGAGGGGGSERLTRLASLLRDADAVEAKMMEAKAILSTVSNNSEAIDALLDSQGRRTEEMVKGAVSHAMELATDGLFWSRLTPRLAEAGFLKDLPPDVLVRVEVEKARAQEEIRVRGGVAEKVERARAEGWRLLARGMSEDFNEHLPIRALVLLGVCAGYFALRLAYQVLLRRAMIPPLVEETSVGVWSCRRRRQPNASGDLARTLFKSQVPEIVLAADVQESISDMAHVAMSAAGRARPSGAKGLALPNAVFFGPPGTGKSLTARRLATACGLDYAIMSGGSVLGLREEAVPELRRVFGWARRAPRGLVLFVDEAEAFLSQRGAGASPFVQAAVSFFLAQTTSSSTRLMVILATNRARELDEAVLSRMAFQIEFGRPDRLMLQRLVDDRMEALQADARLALKRVLDQAGVDLHRLGLTGRDAQSLFEEFERRWSLRCATGGQKDVDQAWLRRWLRHRSMDGAGEASLSTATAGV